VTSALQVALVLIHLAHAAVDDARPYGLRAIDCTKWSWSRMSLAIQNAARWQVAKVHPDRQAEFESVAKRLIAAKPRYEVVAARTNVPWYMIAVIHEREAGQNWERSIAQGDPWDRKSVHVPAGRGPFKSWEDAAIDALTNCAPYAARCKDWSSGGMLALLESYNGLGYAHKGLPSPYIWSGTDQYVSGKYVRDGVFDPKAVDKQLGCAGLLLAMVAIDPSISLTHSTAASSATPAVATKPTTSKGGFWRAMLAALLQAFSKRA
jgi:lysozyme family protein